MRAVTRSAVLLRNIEAAGVPGVSQVWAHECGGSRMLIGVGINQRYPGHAKQAGHIASHCQAGVDGNRWVIVTDDDIDVSNLEELIWAALARSDPATSIDLVTGGKGAVSDPRLSPRDRAQKNFVNSRLIIDACVPYHWRDEFPEINKPSREHARLAEERFGWLVK
jgi:4-hydroxy-3-polyprenylbenzoate decarboxylase